MRYIAYVLIGLLTCAGCSRKDVDLTEPQQVAEAFCSAMAADELDLAMSYVLPADRGGYREATVEILKESPPFPKKPRIVVEINEQRGLLTIQNWADGTLGGEMTYQSNRWWMCN